MIGTLMGVCILGMFLVGVLVPVGILIYEVVATIKNQIWNKSKVVTVITTSETFSTHSR